MKTRAFTLIELLIVVAIIAILAAIAVPNFLEAQTRAKISRGLSDMKALVTATAAYRVDHNGVDPTPVYPSAGDYDRIWLGFASPRLTSPVAYITSLPVDIYPETVMAPRWRQLDPARNNTANQPYFVIVRVKRRDNGAEIWHYSRASVQSIIDAGRASSLDPNTISRLDNARSVFHSAGPDTRLTMPSAAHRPRPNTPFTIRPTGPSRPATS